MDFSATAYSGWSFRSGALKLTLLWLDDSPHSGSGYMPGVASGLKQRTVLIPEITHNRFS